jgi:hypothetical protein
MDRLKNMGGDLGGIGDHLKGIDFPIQKDQLVSQLEQKGVPSMITDKLKGADTDQFQDADDVKSKIGGML